jgi:single-stranded DNA-specific DHH superfamily exonuclease
MRPKAIVFYHGDCDGVISAGLYIRHFLRDYFPDRIDLKYSHPWRLHEDLEKAIKSLKDDVDLLVLLDLAISSNVAEVIKRIASDGRTNIVIVDHHPSSMRLLDALKALEKVKVYWLQSQSTPAVLASFLIKSMNDYERLLIKVADVCEGGRGEDDEQAKAIADKVKLALAVEPDNESLIRSSVESIVKGVEFWNTKEFNEKYSKAKWLLQVLLKRIEERATKVCNWSIVWFTASESIIYAGLFGIASTEYVKKFRTPIVLVREEEKKMVVTVRSPDRKALDFCKQFAEDYGNVMSIMYGGHREAASLTIKKDRPLHDVIQFVKEFIQKRFC